VAIINSRLRKTIANQYLIVLTLADSVFLIGITFILFKVRVPCLQMFSIKKKIIK
jgi:hypothetical protein